MYAPLIMRILRMCWSAVTSIDMSIIDVNKVLGWRRTVSGPYVPLEPHEKENIKILTRVVRPVNQTK